MKRKLMVAFLLSALMVLALAVTASAQAAGPGPGPNQGADCPHGGFVDEDNDGVCDLAPEDGSGQQRGRMSRGNSAAGQSGQGPNYQDDDNDGICDHQGDGGSGYGRMDEQRGRRGGHHGRDVERRGGQDRQQNRQNDGQGYGPGGMGRGNR